MQNKSPDRIEATFKETGGFVNFNTRLEGDSVIFPGTNKIPVVVPLSAEEERDIRQALVSLKSLDSETGYPHPVSGADQSMLTLEVTQPPTLAMKVRGSMHNSKTPGELFSIRRIVGQASRRIPRPQ